MNPAVLFIVLKAMRDNAGKDNGYPILSYAPPSRMDKVMMRIGKVLVVLGVIGISVCILNILLLFGWGVYETMVWALS